GRGARALPHRGGVDGDGRRRARGRPRWGRGRMVRRARHRPVVLGGPGAHGREPADLAHALPRALGPSPRPRLRLRSDRRRARLDLPGLDRLGPGPCRRREGPVILVRLALRNATRNGTRTLLTALTVL